MKVTATEYVLNQLILDSQMEGVQEDMYGMEGDMEYGEEMMGSEEEGDQQDMGEDSYGMEGSPDGY